MKARELFQKSLSISIPEYGPENIEIAQIHDLLAETLCLEDRDEEALQHLLLAMKIYKIYNDPKILGRVYCLHGIILEKIDDGLQSVINAYNLSRDQYLSIPDKEKTDVDKIGLASTYFKLASVEDRNGRLTSASKNYLSK
jgi:tetratricopeptide (TPR) repeat protein